MFGTYQRLGLPVCASDMDVIRATRRKLEPRHLYNRQHRAGRHAIYRAALDHHHRAESLYFNVMKGNI